MLGPKSHRKPMLTQQRFTGSTGTAVDTHREQLLSASPVSGALHKLSRPKTVRHTLTPPRVRDSVPPALMRPDSLSTHASGGSVVFRASAHFGSSNLPSTVPDVVARDICSKKTDGKKRGQTSIEMKGDRCVLLRYCCRCYL